MSTRPGATTLILDGSALITGDRPRVYATVGGDAAMSDGDGWD
ncbi:MAG TPA: hypothetical protein VMR16_01170 [Candidatus Saccharimonadales bacterium]|nr:hypothetical protein [Candidatus Saccharimonadales bacterium]